MKQFRRIFLLSLILAAALFTDGVSSGIKFNIYAVKYGESMFSNRFIYQGDRSNGSSKFCWMFYYIEYGDRKILVDTGFNDQKSIKVFSIKNFKDPVSIIADNGISADSITDIIITHAHFDHIGNVSRFKNAKIIIQKDELSSVKSDKQLTAVKKFLDGNRNVTTFDDSITLYEMFIVKKIGGHTKGSSVVLFNHDNKKYCLTGDEIYLKDNITKNTGSGSVVNRTNNTGFINMLREQNYITFTFHDNSYYGNPKRFINVFP